MEYYLWTKNGQQGPFTREELESMYRTGQLLEPDLQYTTDDGESWYPMGHLFAPGVRTEDVADQDVYAEDGGEGPASTVAGAGIGAPSTSKRSGRIGSGVGQGGRGIGRERERDRLAPLDIGAQADIPGGSSSSKRNRERPMKPKGPQHRTQRIEPSDSYVRLKDAIKPPVAYRIMRDGQESGPFEEPFLRRWVETGALEKDTPSRRDGTRDWEPLWHLLKMSPPGPVEVEMAQGRRAMRSLVGAGRVLVIVGVALLVWGVLAPIMRTVYPISATLNAGGLRVPGAVYLWDFHQAALWVLVLCGLMSLLACLSGSSRWLWVSWGGVLAGAAGLGAAMLQHQILLREHVTLLRPPGIAGITLQRKFLEEMGMMPTLEFGSVLLLISVLLIGIGAMVLQLAMSSRWRRL